MAEDGYTSPAVPTTGRGRRHRRRRESEGHTETQEGDTVVSSSLTLVVLYIGVFDGLVQVRDAARGVCA